jgi:signal transduction histidine kinase/DNA-binding LacI/PurR family transcriptional regulator/AraC-like DNA-binding protein
MNSKASNRRPTIGVLAGWHLYWTATPLNYLAPVFRGISRAAIDLDCNLLLGCGIGHSASPEEIRRPAWPILAPDADFVPIGPANTDAIIVANPLQSEARSRYIQDLIQARHPILFIGPGEDGPAIAIDNAGGIMQAMHHLFGHGHRKIAFVAGSVEDRHGDTGERLRAYHAALREHGLPVDERLIAFGQHSYHEGYAAMKKILDSGVPFTAVLASNDESAIGAMQMLKEAGRRIPDDVAIMGFDDRIECLAQEPTLSSVRVPLFNLGYRSLELAVELLSNGHMPPEVVRLPTRLVPRESCGCSQLQEQLPEQIEAIITIADPALRRTQLIQTAATAILFQTQSLSEDRCLSLARRVFDSFQESLNNGKSNRITPFRATLEDILRQTAAAEDDVFIWQEALSILGRALPTLIRSEAELIQANRYLDEARVMISTHMRQQRRRIEVAKHWTEGRLSVLTSKLLTALDETQIYQTLAEFLPECGIFFAAVARLRIDDDAPTPETSIRVVTLPDPQPVTFPTYTFPPAALVDPDVCFKLALLPLINSSGQFGYMVFNLDHLELYGTIVQQLAGAANTAQLYREATEGRRLAEEANQLKSRFLSMVGHELRTPLNMIVGLSGLLTQEIRSGKIAAAPSIRTDIERIHAQAQHLGGLIGDVLDLASSDANRLRLSKEFVDLSQAMRIVNETGHHLAAEKGLGWRSSLPDSGPWVWGDRTRLRQVALNLISNAVKFTAQGSIELRIEIEDEQVTVMVIDTGLGIPPDEQDAIFDEFRQSERTIARGIGGLGLGLAICKRLVDMHDGALNVYSSGEEGAGSTFSFTLPRVHPPLDFQANAVVEGRNVLLLTASESSSQRLHQHLVREGFGVHVEPMGANAMWESSLAATAPDALVLDVSGGTEHVWNVIRATADNPTLRGLPLLFYSLDDQSGAALEFDYLTKPVRLSELKRAIAQHTDPIEAPKRTILIVDDDASTLDVHARIVKSQDPSNQVIRAQNGREALDILQKVQVNLVLLDLMMPEMDGFEVLEAMQDRESTRQIPVIVLTGRQLTESDMARLNRGVTTVLSKGLFNIEETLTHISDALTRKRKLSSEAQRLVRQAMIYLHDHFSESITRGDIAQHVGLAEDYLTHCFREEMGMTPIAYLNRYRVNQAKRRLKETERTITEIALDIGFSDSGYFSRVFRRETGMSPDAFRRA